ncbi:crotonase/enoyl-CoA hydratase family protein [Promicromonospora thailandica]|uniref:Enoyl-CoA hydratase/carnithine racemase n=1 Tax=Promicromonospora thailandica TaxID=765201 RepID=A0A9X2FYQ9_9MICO|nr:crotonase/enoyl-CoA hydratase family protein [Promicromonospora thailandica]MCP2262970.1 Enoyl-CoA hydratase/carnithine racemase [Promicromonospora thailandica]BFF18331.1 crotonase/enoyl-CoA hydratase family protein [Promicromonospora thailandica]
MTASPAPAVPAGRHITCSVSDGIADVRLDRPDKLNALSLDMLRELRSTARRLRHEPGLRAVVVSGNGRSFCAGLDLGAAARNPAAVARAFVPTPRGTNLFQEACWAWRRLPVPVIAAVHGHVIGAGVQIALAADLRLTTPDARWSVKEVERGLVPDMSGIRALTQLVGIETAKRLTLTADEVTGADAARLGLAGTVTDTPREEAFVLAARIAEHRPAAVAAAKRLFDRHWSAGDLRTFAAERRAQLRLLPGAMRSLKR